LALVRQRIDTRREKDVASAVRREMTQMGLERQISAGDSVALTAGSRGIADVVPVLRETVRWLREQGADPFVVPAMGSHGGGTAEGQQAILHSYGITPESVEAPIRASMDVVEIGRHPMGGPVYLDRIAAQANHIGIVARIKPHTGFTGSIESGLVKMMMIGLGKHEGAKEYHRVLVRHAWEPFARTVARTVLERAPIRFGLAIIENALDETAAVEGVAADAFLDREPALLELARKHMPRLPVDEVDLLIIDEIGKDVSGAGADTNVIGRKPALDWNERDVRNPRPLVHRIFVRGLTKASHGNAAGIGLADFTTDRLVQSMDYQATVINCLTANHPLGAAIPVKFPTDRQAIEAAVNTVGLERWGDAKIAWITNTLHIERLALSTTYDLSTTEPAVDVVATADWPFDDAGNLTNLSEVWATVNSY
jgi:hypothetical protein